MEKAFIVTETSEYYKDLHKFIKMAKQQREFLDRFLAEKGIEANECRVGGDGFVNQPFSEGEEKDIRLYIIPTEKDTSNFGKMLCKPDDRGLCAFKKNSKIAKEFAQKCIEEQIVINLYEHRLDVYFPSIGLSGYGISRFKYNDALYLKVKSDNLKDDDIPEGFIEIKLSKFYRINEENEE